MEIRLLLLVLIFTSCSGDGNKKSKGSESNQISIIVKNAYTKAPISSFILLIYSNKEELPDWYLIKKKERVYYSDSTGCIVLPKSNIKALFKGANSKSYFAIVQSDGFIDKHISIDLDDDEITLEIEPNGGGVAILDNLNDKSDSVLIDIKIVPIEIGSGEFGGIKTTINRRNFQRKEILFFTLKTHQSATMKAIYYKNGIDFYVKTIEIPFSVKENKIILPVPSLLR